MCYSVLDFCSHFLHSWDAVTQSKLKKKWFAQAALYSSAKGKNTLLLCCHGKGVSIQLLFLSYGTVTWTAQNTCQITEICGLSPAISASWTVWVWLSCMNFVMWHGHICDVTVLKLERRAEQIKKLDWQRWKQLDTVVGKLSTWASTYLPAWHTLQSTFSKVPSPVWAYRLCWYKKQEPKPLLYLQWQPFTLLRKKKPNRTALNT